MNSALDFLKDIYDSESFSYYNIVLKCKFNENELLFNHKFMNLIGSTTGRGYTQNEVLHIGKNPIKVTIILNEETMLLNKNK